MFKIKNAIVALVFVSAFFIFPESKISASTNSIDYDKEKKSAYHLLTNILADNSNYLPYRLNLLKEIALMNGVSTNIDTNTESFKPNTPEEKIKQELATYWSNVNTAYKANMFYLLSQSNQPQIKDAADKILNKIHDNEDLPLFLNLAKSTDKRERAIGISGILRIKNKNSIDSILDLLNNCDSAEKKVITGSLIDFPINQKITDYAKTLVKKEKNTEILTNLYVLLVKSGETIYLKNYKELLFSEEELVYRYAAVKLNKLSEYIDIKSVESLFNSDDDVVKMGIIIYSENYLQKKNINDNDIEQQKILNKLRDYAFEKNEIISISAIKVLSEVKDKKIYPYLNGLINNKKTSIIAVNVILKTQNDNLIPIWKELVNFKDDNIRLRAIKLLISNNQNSKNSLKLIIKDPKTSLLGKLMAASALSKEYNTHNYLKTFLNSDNTKVKESALLQLARNTGNKRYIKSLKQIAFDYFRNENDLKAAIILLNKYNDRSGLKIIKNYLSSRKIVDIPPKYLDEDILTEYLNDKDPWVVLNSAYILALSGNNKGLEVLRDLLLTSSGLKIKAAVASIFSEVGGTTDIQVLKSMYNNKYVRIRVNAAQSVLGIIENTMYKERNEKVNFRGKKRKNYTASLIGTPLYKNAQR